MKKESLWMDGTSTPKFPKLSGQVKVDVAIVGAGITGLTTAYLLQKAGCSVAVIDQKTIGCGETGHTTAHLTCVTDTRLHELSARIGKVQSQAFWDAGVLGMRQIEEIAKETQADCELRQVPGYLYAATDQDASKEIPSLRKDASLAMEMGFDAHFLKEDPVFKRPAACFPDQLKFHPLKYLHALAKDLHRDDCHIFCHTHGSEIDAKKHELHAEGGTIHYDSLVAATHVPIQGERGTLGAALFQTRLAAYSTYAIEASVDCVPESLFWDTDDPYTYWRFDRRDGECFVIVGGEDHKTGQEEHTEACYDRLEGTLKKHFPSARPHHRWSGQVLETPDGLPYIGEVESHQFLATGFSGNGMTLGTFSASLIRDLVAGKTNPWTDLFSPHRKALSGTWEYLRENKDYPAYLVRNHLKPASRLEDIPRGAGAIVKVDGRKQAVYCDPQGKRTVLSPICPHMGCIVAWNEAESTWDCPCHGSRFTATGKLMAGPAETDLSESA